MTVHSFPNRGHAGQPPAGGDGMDARIAKLESDVGHMRTDIQEIKGDVKEIKKDAREDFRTVCALIIAAVLGLAALMAKGFKWF